VRILVTGATGFVGANLVHALVEEASNKVFITVRPTSILWRVEDIQEKLQDFYPVDLSDRKQVFNLIEHVKPDVIYHLATYGGFKKELDIDNTIKTNLFATIHLLDAAVQLNVKHFVNTGSSSEYGMKDHPMKEDSVCCPSNLYGVTKLAATNYCSMIGKRRLYKVCTLRLFSPYGKFEDSTRLYPTIVNALLAGKRPQLSNPKNVRDFIEVSQVVSIFKKVINCEYDPGDIINVGSGSQQTVEEFYKKIADSMNSKIEPLWYAAPTQTLEPNMWEADIRKLQKLHLIG